VQSIWALKDRDQGGDSVGFSRVSVVAIKCAESQAKEKKIGE